MGLQWSSPALYSLQPLAIALLPNDSMPTSRIPALYTRLARDDAPPRIASTTPASMLVVRGSGVEGATVNGPHVLTVAHEDYYHVGAFNRLIQRGQWYR